MKIVLLGREKINQELRNLLAEQPYRNKVCYLIGKALNIQDFARIDLRYLLQH